MKKNQKKSPLFAVILLAQILLIVLVIFVYKYNRTEVKIINNGNGIKVTYRVVVPYGTTDYKESFQASKNYYKELLLKNIKQSPEQIKTYYEKYFSTLKKVRCDTNFENNSKQKNYSTWYYDSKRNILISDITVIKNDGINDVDIEDSFNQSIINKGTIVRVPLFLIPQDYDTSQFIVVDK